MTYAQRWLVAVAMKQPYPRTETGAVRAELVAENQAEVDLQARSIFWSFGAAVVVGGLAYWGSR